MKIARCGRWIIAGLTLALSVLCASGEDANYGQPLLLVSFDHLVPITYPIHHPSFDRLASTTYPLIQPGAPLVHITNNLTQSFTGPLLITNEFSYPARLGLPPAADSSGGPAHPTLVTRSAVRPPRMIQARASTSPKGRERRPR